MMRRISSRTSPHNKVVVITMPIDPVMGAIVAISIIVGNKDSKVELNSKARPRKLQKISSIIQGNMMPPCLTSH